MVETAIINVAPGKDEAVVSLLDRVMSVKEWADKRVIINAEDAKSATEDLSVMAHLRKTIEDKRKEYVGPLQEHVKTINDAFKILSIPLGEADKLTRGKVLAYQQVMESKRQEQERINALRLEAAQKEMDLKGELSESVNLVPVIQALKRVITDMGSAGQRDHWKYEVVDFALVPNEYKMPDTVMLNAIAKKHHDQKQIPGIRFYNEPILAVNTRKVV